MRTRRSIAALSILLAGASMSSCVGLRDAEPFTRTVVYDEDETTGRLTVEPLEWEADWSYGEVQVVNRTNEEHGFAIRELAVFARIPKGLTRIVNVDEARDNRTYVFECQLHDNEYRGTMKVDYKTEDERE